MRGLCRSPRPRFRAGRSTPPRRARTTYDGSMPNDYWAAVVWSLAPTVVVLGLFIFVLRSILRMDRSERRVYSRIEAEERAKRGLPATEADSASR